jgi:cytochrome c oxidase cbb3-type subunit 1
MHAAATQSTSASPACPLPATAEEVDASCRGPVLFLFFNSIIWLLLWSVVALIAAIKMHSGNFLADIPLLTYGRLVPAQRGMFLYGFASQAGLGVALWLLARLGRTPLYGGPAALVGGKFWNLGVLVGVIGILLGDSTGYESFEFPRYAAPILFFAYLFIGVPAMRTFLARRDCTTYISQWLIFAALLIFPWIDATGNILLICHPVRGAMQSVIAYWFANNFVQLWLAPLALAAIFYFIPKISGKPLYSYYLAVVGFWLLVLVGGWCGIPPGARLPSWMPSLSTAANMLMLVPVFAALINWRLTLSAGEEGCNCSILRQSLPFRFTMVAVVSYAMHALLAAGTSLKLVSRTTEFTLFTNALSLLSLYGFIAMSLFGAVYYIVPQLTAGTEWQPTRTKWHYILSTLGIILIVLGYGIGGFMQGNAQFGADFLKSIKVAVPFIGLATLGLLFLLAAHVLFLCNFMCVMRRCCAACCGCGKEAKK